ncbi:MAG: serine/threonine-protein kinase [Luteolibacter sp.]
MRVSPLVADAVFDGYRLIRFLGKGGFGEVWLCRSETVGDFRAFKWISSSDTGLLEKELHALRLYRETVENLHSPHLVPIHHIGGNAAGLYYVMPLADGWEDSPVSPDDPAWSPLCLASEIENRRSQGRWFSSGEIVALFSPVLQALQALTGAGLVHRDVKPDNILFLNGKPCLGDIGLLGRDHSLLTQQGTPGYSAPSWYTGGHFDMYSAAATLYTLLTGNSPDKMGRANFKWPPGGETSLSVSERAEWKRLHGIIRRATEEDVNERYVDFLALAAALGNTRKTENDSFRPARSKRWISVLSVTLTLAVMALFFFKTRPRKHQSEEIRITPEPPLNVTSSKITEPPDKPLTALPDDQVRFGLSPREKILRQLPKMLPAPPPGGKRNFGAFANTSRLSDALERKDDGAALEAFESLMDNAAGAVGLSWEASMLYAYLLEKNGRHDDSQRILDSIPDPEPGNDLQQLECRMILWEAVGKYEKAEALLGNLIAKALENISKTEAGHLEKLYQFRARMRMRQSNFEGAFSDEIDSLKIPIEKTLTYSLNSRDSPLDEMQTGHHNTTVQRWFELSEEFPGYRKYLVDHNHPEPKGLMNAVEN